MFLVQFPAKTLKSSHNPDRLAKCMPGDNRSLIYFKNGSNIWLDPADTNYRIFTLTDDLKLAKFPLEKYRSINFDSLKNTPNAKYTFELEVINKKIKTREDIEEILSNSK